MSCQSTGTLAVMNPDTPPITNSRIIEEKNRNAVVMTGRPSQIVASHANTATAEGTVITIEAPEKNDSPSPGRPVANIWWTQTPKPRIMVATVDSASSEYPTTGRRQNTGNPSDTMPIAGSTIA